MCQWPAALKRGSPASFLLADAPLTGHTFSSAIRSSIQERRGKKLCLMSGLDENALQLYALPTELSELTTENFSDLCVMSARRVLSLGANWRTTIAGTQGNAHSSVMYVETSLDTKVRLRCAVLHYQHCPTLSSFRRPDKAPEKPAWNPQVGRVWQQSQLNGVDIKRRRSNSGPGSKSAGQDAVHAVNHRGDLLLHLLLPVQPGDVRRHLPLRFDGGGVAEQV